MTDVYTIEEKDWRSHPIYRGGSPYWRLVRDRRNDYGVMMGLYDSAHEPTALLWTLKPWMLYVFPTLEQAQLVFDYMNAGIQHNQGEKHG